ncbi:MAG: BspA family leucine-rich repeat surface protein [Spirochaetia bacterium]|nr:BspA family leucine-rich repeat surface protein [Spirochaetia bacterium]
MKARCINAIICLIILVFFCILACDNGSVSDSSASKSSGLVDVSLTLDSGSSAGQKSISVDSNYDPSKLNVYYKATPQWSQDRPIHGDTNNQFVLIPNYNSSSPATLGRFTAGEWLFDVQVTYGSTLIYQGTSAVTSIYTNHTSVNVMVNKIIQASSGTVSVTVTAPTVDDEEITVAWHGTASGSSGPVTGTPLDNGTTEFTYTASGLSSGYYTFTLAHSSTGAGAAIAVDLRAGERAEITGHLDNGIWQLGYITVKVHPITLNLTGCSYQFNLTSAAAGDKVSFHLEPHAGNVLQGNVSVTWTGGSINPIVPNNGLYTFVMPEADDVTINAVYSGVGSDIDIPLFKALFKILHDSYPGATSFGYDSGSIEGDYFETKGVKLWYDSVKNKICWKNDAGTFRFKAGSLANFFKDCSIFTNINLSGIDTSLVTNMSGMFRGCEGLTEVVLDTEKDANGKFVHFNTKSVTDMSYMFCSKTIESKNVKPSAMKLATVDVSGLDTSSVTNMSYMFYMCYQLSTLDVSGFKTPLVTDMSNMFACYNFDGTYYPGHLNSLNLYGWDFTNVTTTAKMFDRQEELASFTFPPTTNFASLTTMTYMFSHCLALTPETFRDIVATWTFADNPNGVYGDGTHAGDMASLFGNNQNNNSGDNNGANYIFRENTMTDKGQKFADRAGYATQDGHTLYIGGGKNQKSARLTTKE